MSSSAFFSRQGCASCTITNSRRGFVRPFQHHLQAGRRPHRVLVQATQRDYAELVTTRSTLKKQLKEAVEQEDYSTAAKLKKEIEQLDQEDPAVQLQTSLDRAVADERYEDAARLREQLRALAAQIGYQPVDPDKLTTISNVATHGIRVHVRSFFLPAQSAPHLHQYNFCYQVVITNESKDIVQLRQRHWIIVDGNGKKEEVRGPGVVGKQPILNPGKSYDYMSGCPLRTPEGSMEGEYDMAVLDEETGEWRDFIEVKIGKFKLSTQGELLM